MTSPRIFSVVILSIGLGACAPHGANSFSAKSIEASRAGASPLEEKIDRLQATVERLMRERDERLGASQKYMDCNDSCARRFPWQDKTNDIYRAQCFEDCEKIKPIGMSPEC